MAATLSRIIYDQSTGDERMFIHPDDDAELNDAAFRPSGTFWADVSRAGYQSCVGLRDRLALAIPVLTAKRQALGDLAAQKIALVDALEKLRTDRTLLDQRLDDGGPDPTPIQQTLINAARAKVLQDLSDIQTIRDAIQAILAQL